MLLTLSLYLWPLVFAACAVAALIYLPAPLKGIVVGVCLLAAVADLGYSTGRSGALREAKEASVLYQAKIDRRDLTISETMAALEASTQAVLEARSETDTKVALYEKKLTESRACPLTDGDRERLLDIR